METSSNRQRLLTVAALIAAGLALFAALWKPYASSTADEALTVGGFGNSGNTLYGGGPPLARYARKAVDLGLAPRIADDELRRVIESVRGRALQGEPDAAAFVIEMAAVERAREAQKSKGP